MRLLRIRPLGGVWAVACGLAVTGAIITAALTLLGGALDVRHWPGLSAPGSPVEVVAPPAARLARPATRPPEASHARAGRPVHAASPEAARAPARRHAARRHHQRHRHAPAARPAPHRGPAPHLAPRPVASPPVVPAPAQPAPVAQPLPLVPLPPAAPPAVSPVPSPAPSPIAGGVTLTLRSAVLDYQSDGPPGTRTVHATFSLAGPAVGEASDVTLRLVVRDVLPGLEQLIGGPAAVTSTVDVVTTSSPTAGTPGDDVSAPLGLRVRTQVGAARDPAGPLASSAPPQDGAASNAVALSVPLEVQPAPAAGRLADAPSPTTATELVVPIGDAGKGEGGGLPALAVPLPAGAQAGAAAATVAAHVESG